MNSFTPEQLNNYLVWGSWLLLAILGLPVIGVVAYLEWQEWNEKHPRAEPGKVRELRPRPLRLRPS